MAKIDIRPPIIVSVYLKKQLKRGTLRGIIRNAGLTREEFLELHNPKSLQKRTKKKRNN